MRRALRTLPIGIGLAWAGGAWAATPCAIDDGPLALDGASCTAWRYDATGTATFDQIAADEAAFEDMRRGGLHLGYRSGALWLRIGLVSAATRDRAVRVVVGPPQLDVVDAWLDDGRTVRLGDHRTPRDRSTPHRRPTIETPIAPGETRVIWVRIATRSLLSIAPRVLDARAHGREVQRDERILFALVGTLAATVGLFGLFAVGGRDRAFGWYTAHSALALGFILAVSGTLGQLAALRGVFGRTVVLSFALASVAAGIQHTRHLHEDIDRRSVREGLLRGVLGLLAVGFVALLALPGGGAIAATAALGVGVWAVTLAAAMAARERRPWATFTVAAWAPIAGVSLVVLLSGVGRPVPLTLAMDLLRVAFLWLVLATAATLALRFGVQRRGEARALALALSEARQRAQTERALGIRDRALERAQRTEAIGRLAAGVAHDFNNLLTVIFSSAEEVEEATDDAEIRSRIAEIREAGGRAAALVGHLLAYSRRKPTSLAPIDLNEILSAMLPILGSDGIDLEARAQNAVILGDRVQIEQVVVNLVANARDAMPAGGLVAIRTHDSPDGAPFVGLTVEDSGTGIDEADLPNLFDPFFTTKPIHEGGGLGLSTASGIVDRHGGRIEVDSEVGRGSRFTVWLPLTQRPEPAAPETPDPPRTLLAEDDPGVRRVLQRILAASGLDLDVVCDGAEALARLEEKRYDLLVTDVSMPGASGAEVLARARQLAPDLPAVIVSGYADPLILEELARDPNTHVIAKPFAVADLQGAVNDLLPARADRGGDES